jgi:hypothetical protein
VEKSIELLSAMCFLVIGLSHIVQGRAWFDFFQGLRSQGRPGVFVYGFICLSYGSLVVAFHNVWTWPALVLTVLGWGQVIKGLRCFVVPQFTLRLLERASPGRAWEFQAAGAGLLAISTLCWYLVFTR